MKTNIALRDETHEPFHTYNELGQSRDHIEGLLTGRVKDDDPNHESVGFKAIESDLLKIVQNLINDGDLEAIKNIIDSKGINPLQVQNYNSLLISAVRTEQIEIVRYFLEVGKGFEEIVNDFTVYILHPLYCASSNSETTIAKLLLEKGADLNSYHIGSRCLKNAALRGNSKMINLFLEYGAKLDLSECNLPSSLFLFALPGESEYVQRAIELLRSYSEKNKENKDLLIQLEKAFADGGSLEFFSKLIELGADVSADIDSMPLLEHANHYKQMEIAQLLIEKGAPIDVKILFQPDVEPSLFNFVLDQISPEDINLPQIFECNIPEYEDVCEPIKRLIEKGVNINQVNKSGQNLLMLSANQGRMDMVNMLLGEGAQLSWDDLSRLEFAKDPYTNLLSSVADGNLDVVKRLLVEIAQRNNDGSENAGMLLEYAELGELELAKKLIENGADPNYLFSSSLLVSAVRNHNLELVELLLESGADPNLDVTGTTALGRAASDGNTDVVLVLLEYGASIEQIDSYAKKAVDHARHHNHADIVFILEESSNKH